MININLKDIPLDIDKKEYLMTFMKNGKTELTFLYDSDFSNTPLLRAFVEAIFDIHGVDAREKNRLILVSDELNNNAIEHGSIKGTQNEMMVSMKKEGDLLNIVVEITDNGSVKAGDMEKLKETKHKEGISVRGDSIRGRGLFLIAEKIADKLYFKNTKKGGLTVGIEKTV